MLAAEALYRFAGWADAVTRAASSRFDPALRDAGARRRTTIVVSATLLLLGGCVAEAAAREGVLILHSNQRPTPAAIVIEETLRKVVPEALGRPVELYSEYLDSERFAVELSAGAQAEFLREKYSGRNIRVIVASALPALQFAKDFRDRMFAGVPVVHLAVPKDELERMTLPTNIVGRSEDLDPTATLELALHLQPGGRRVVIVTGVTQRDRVWEERLRAAVGRLKEHPEVEYLSGLPTAEVQRRLAALSRGAVVYTPGYFTDGAGYVGTPRQSLELIASASAAPVYGALDTFLGTGIVGGYMTPYEEQAKQAAGIVVRLLNGAAPSEITSSPVPWVPIVDWRQIRRFGIDERLLPADTIVKFREPTAWDKYRQEISAGIAILLLQAGLIAALLIERRSRRRTAVALAETHQQMNLAARAARLTFWIWDVAQDGIKALARARHRAPPPTEQTMSLKDVLDAAHPADRQGLRRAVEHSRATGEELDVEYRVTAGGEERWLAVRGRAEKDHPEWFLGVAMDITDRKMSELRAAEDRNALRLMTRISMIGQLSAAIAHQLNQPLAAILGNAEAAQQMLEREPIDLKELAEICGDIVTEDRRASEIIRRLSALYKRGDMKVEALDLNHLIRETLELLHTELLLRHVTPQTDLAPDLPAIAGGSVQLQQVVLNLVMNAADALSAVEVRDRKLAIRTESNGSEVRLYVTDNGSGIAPGDLGKIFEPFWSTKAEGMGVGLAICRSIVAAHRGTISAANNADGGATFSVSLPLRQAA